MARVNYDAWEGFERLSQTAEKIDPRAPEIFAYHTALEMEIDFILKALLPRAEKLTRFGFGNKVKVLHAAWIGEPEAGDILCDVLYRFNELRNAIAHFDSKQFDSCLSALRKAYSSIEPRGADLAEIDEIALGICSYMGDGPSPVDVDLIAEKMQGFIDRYSALFRVPDIKAPKIDLPEIELPALKSAATSK